MPFTMKKLVRSGEVPPEVVVVGASMRVLQPRGLLMKSLGQALSRNTQKSSFGQELSRLKNHARQHTNQEGFVLPMHAHVSETYVVQGAPKFWIGC